MKYSDRSLVTAYLKTKEEIHRLDMFQKHTKTKEQLKFRIFAQFTTLNYKIMIL